MEIQVLDWLVQDLRANGASTEKTIIYCPSISACNEVYGYLQNSLRADGYKDGKLNSFSHRLYNVYFANVGPTTKKHIQDSFPSSDSVIRVLIATIAFGIGVDVPDISRVVHWGLSKNALSFWQETGRGGRNGGAATEHLYVVPKYFHAKDTDKDFVQSIKEIGGLAVRQRGKQRSKSTQTTESALPQMCESVSEEPQPPICFRRFILRQLLLDGMKGLEVLDDLDCSQNEELCPLRRCCSFCIQRCGCMEIA